MKRRQSNKGLELWTDRQKKVWRQLHKNAASNTEQVLEPAPHNEAAARPPTIRKTIRIRRTRHAGHCWSSRDELISDLILWTPWHGQAKAGDPAQTYIEQLCVDTGRSPEDLSIGTIGWGAKEGQRYSCWCWDMIMMMMMKRVFLQTKTSFIIIVNFTVYLHIVCMVYIQSLSQIYNDHRLSLWEPGLISLPFVPLCFFTYYVAYSYILIHLNLLLTSVLFYSFESFSRKR